MLEEETTKELEGSELGTKEYWDKTYECELQNYKDHGDVGEVWFGEDSALRVIRWMKSSSEIKPDDEIIDLGCGNGMMLIEVAREGFCRLTGVDYSASAVNLAKSITDKQDIVINYQVSDLLAEESLKSLGEEKFKVALDKGTYDAISLHPEDPKEKRLAYLNSVYRILAPGGLFILTSCNWTQSELVKQLENRFKMVNIIPTPNFQFGGKTGNLVTSLVFMKT